MNKFPNWSMPFVFSVFMFLAWPPLPVFPLLFIAFIPLFELDQRLGSGRNKRFFLLIYSAFFLWNLFTTWWVWNSTAWGCVVMLIFNSLFMTIPWMLMRYSRKFVSQNASRILLIIFWLLFEYLHQRWDLSWPWLTLGNGFAGSVWFVQWYEITGTTGGSALILLVNLLLFRSFYAQKKRHIFAALSILAVALLASLVLLLNAPSSGNRRMKVVLLQPSFDPWNEKFIREPADMISEMLQISGKQTDSSTGLLVWPETSLTDNIDVRYPQQDYQVNMLRKFRNQYPEMEILTGANMQQLYPDSDRRPNSTARPTDNPRLWWDAYNSAVFIGKNDNIQMYHKAKLVPGTEQMPLTNWLPAINDLAVKLDENSTTGSLGSSPEPVVFGGNKITPAICYESIYGDYLARFARKGAGMIAVITNDAWWGNTPGYKQHLAYARLRAIEQRKWVVRSANTGISCFINPQGSVISPTAWYEKKAISHSIFLNDEETIYVRLGDTGMLLLIIAGLAIWAFLLRK